MTPFLLEPTMRIKKFNNGLGAILCNSCKVIVKEGSQITKAEWDSTDDLLCDKCKSKNQRHELKYTQKTETHWCTCRKWQMKTPRIPWTTEPPPELVAQTEHLLNEFEKHKEGII